MEGAEPSVEEQKLTRDPMISKSLFPCTALVHTLPELLPASGLSQWLLLRGKK